MPTDNPVWLIIGVLIVVFAAVTIARAVRIVPQTVALIVERLGRYQTTFHAGLHVLIPFVDKVRAGVDLREQVVSFPPQPVITSDNLVVSIDTVLYFQVTDPKAATYEIANYITGIEQLTVTTLRNVIGSMDLEQTLTSRDQINGQLRGVLDEATGRWGIRVNRVELKSIDPPQSIQGSMEQQMRAERDRRAAILTAEGVKQSQILTAEGEKQAAILTAEGEAQAAILRAQGESRAILQVFDAIHRGKPDPRLLAYQYLQKLPEIANGESSKMWIVPTEFTAALNGITQGFGGGASGGSSSAADDADYDHPSVEFGAHESPAMASALAETTLEDPDAALRRAQGEAADAADVAEKASDRTSSSRVKKRDTGAGSAAQAGGAAPAAPPASPAPEAGDGSRFAPPASGEEQGEGGQQADGGEPGQPPQ